MDPAVERLLKGPNFADVVTRRGGDRLRMIVLWVDARDGEVLLNGSEGARHWLEDVRADPRVLLTVVNREDPYEYVTIEGRVVGETHEGANEHIRDLELTYRGSRNYPFKDGEQRVIIRVAPDAIRHRVPS